MSESTWGGKRAGAGRPKGTVKDISIQRKQHQIRAFDEEWSLIQEFVQLVRANSDEARKLLAKAK